MQNPVGVQAIVCHEECRRRFIVDVGGQGRCSRPAAGADMVESVGTVAMIGPNTTSTSLCNYRIWSFLQPKQSVDAQKVTVTVSYSFAARILHL